MDPDDFIDRGWCEEMYLLACRYDVDILIFNFYSIVNGFKQKCLHNIPVGLYDIEEFLITVERLPITPKLYKRKQLKTFGLMKILK